MDRQGLSTSSTLEKPYAQLTQEWGQCQAARDDHAASPGGHAPAADKQRTSASSTASTQQLVSPFSLYASQEGLHAEEAASSARMPAPEPDANLVLVTGGRSEAEEKQAVIALMRGFVKLEFLFLLLFYWLWVVQRQQEWHVL